LAELPVGRHLPGAASRCFSCLAAWCVATWRRRSPSSGRVTGWTRCASPPRPDSEGDHAHHYGPSSYGHQASQRAPWRACILHARQVHTARRPGARRTSRAGPVTSRLRT
jgi:hypothetical protein